MFNIKKRPAREISEERPIDINPLETKGDVSHNLQFPCDLCDFVSLRKRDLRYHMGEKHRHEKVSVKIEKGFSKKSKDGK